MMYECPECGEKVDEEDVEFDCPFCGETDREKDFTPVKIVKPYLIMREIYGNVNFVIMKGKQKKKLMN